MRHYAVILVFLLLAIPDQASSQSQSFTLKIIEPEKQLFHIEMVCSGFQDSELTLVLPNWTPGYYQMLNYAQYVDNVKISDELDKPLAWKKGASNTWIVDKGKSKTMRISYTAKATIPFVAQNLLDAEHGYIMPAGIFMHVKNHLNKPVTLTIHNYPQWSTIATGLEPLKGKVNSFTAPDFDTFYDSPILLGNLEKLEPFKVNGIPHYFIGYKLGQFDKHQFITDLKKIVTEAVAVIGDIPYKHYTFLAIGPVPGGIEHLNSTGFGFSSDDFDQRYRLLRMYTFLSHEYFHHYNAKRIRPVELGPFDYDNGSKTTMLWIAEGFTNYYDELIVKHAGLMSDTEYLESIQERIQSFENKPGRQFQTASDASFQTWTDGPFGRTGDDAYKTISVYEKGSLLGLILDLDIRHSTNNKKSLDDVMRYLYQQYYKKQHRGFSEAEFKAAAETVSGVPMTEFFEYVNTVKEVPFDKYLSYAGLELKVSNEDLPDPYVGLSVREKNDSLVITRSDWSSPSWEASLRSNEKVITVNGIRATKAILDEAVKSNQPLKLLVKKKDGTLQEVELRPVKKTIRVFKISPVASPTPLQSEVYESWLKNR